MPDRVSLYLAGAFHNNQHTLASFEKACTDLASSPRVARLHVTIYESGSTDSTQAMLMNIEQRLRRAHASTAFTINGAMTRGDRQRIDFLADVRNQLLKPLRDMSTMTPFDYVIFFNDVFFTALDVLQLVDVGGDIVCGIDFQYSDGDPNKTLKFYDTWVARTLNGMPFRNSFPFALDQPGNVAAQRRVLDHGYAFFDLLDEFNDIVLPENENTGLVQSVQCCWNGVLAVKAKPLVDGLTFRSNFPNECLAASESHFCTDLWNMGYTRVAVHHGVRLTYDKYPDHVVTSVAPLPVQRNSLKGLFDNAPVRESVCCGMKTQDQFLKAANRVMTRLQHETDGAFAARIWKTVVGYDLSKNTFPEKWAGLKRLVRGEATFHPLTSTWFLLESQHDIQHSPILPCTLSTPRNMTSRIALANPLRSIPRRIIQLGDDVTGEGLSSLMWTWKHLHPDHEFTYFTYNDVVELASSKYRKLYEIIKLYVQGGRASEVRLLAALLLVYEYGGVYVDTKSIATQSLSTIINRDDSLVFVDNAAKSMTFLASTPRCKLVGDLIPGLLQSDVVTTDLVASLPRRWCNVQGAHCLTATRKRECGGTYLAIKKGMSSPDAFSVLLSTTSQHGNANAESTVVDWADCVMKQQNI